MEVHDVLIQVLEQHKIDNVFTYLSEDTMRFVTTLVEDSDYDADLVHSRHEQGAVAMADGYSRAHDDIGFVIVGRGPAVAQTGTALTTARKNGSKLLLIVPSTPLSYDYGHVSRYDVKEFDQESYLESTVGNLISVSSQKMLLSDLKEGFRQIHIGNGPVAIQIPWDILDSELERDLDDVREELTRSTTGLPKSYPQTPDESLVEECIDLYLESAAFQPPIILVGRGAVKAGAKEAIEELAERTNALIATTLQARNYFADHPFNLGVAGNWGSNLASKHFNETELLFAVGCSLNPYTLDKGHLLQVDTTIIHIDNSVDSINRFEEVDLGIVGDAKETVEAIVEELEQVGIDRGDELWTDKLRAEIAEHPILEGRDYPDKEGKIDPRELIRHVDQLVPEDRIVVSDSGHHTRWVTDGIRASPEHFVLSLDFAAVGLGLAMGIGAGHGTERKTCVTFCGDGGFLMALQELESAVRHDVPLILIIVNDQSLGSEFHTLEVSGYSGDVSLISTPDLANVARSLGAEGYTARSIEELHELEDTLGERPVGPIVVDCRVDHEVRHRSKM